MLLEMGGGGRLEVLVTPFLVYAMYVAPKPARMIKLAKVIPVME